MLSIPIYFSLCSCHWDPFFPSRRKPLQGSGASEGANFKTVNIFSLEKELLQGVVFQREQNVKNLRHFFFGEVNYSRGVVFQREQNVKIFETFFL